MSDELVDEENVTRIVIAEGHSTVVDQSSGTLPCPRAHSFGSKEKGTFGHKKVDTLAISQ